MQAAASSVPGAGRAQALLLATVGPVLSGGPCPCEGGLILKRWLARCRFSFWSSPSRRWRTARERRRCVQRTSSGPVKTAACTPRSVPSKWLFSPVQVCPLKMGEGEPSNGAVANVEPEAKKDNSHSDHRDEFVASEGLASAGGQLSRCWTCSHSVLSFNGTAADAAGRLIACRG